MYAPYYIWLDIYKKISNYSTHKKFVIPEVVIGDPDF
jgi:hypothetical protein